MILYSVQFLIIMPTQQSEKRKTNKIKINKGK
jgi:hypothetical protein